MAYVLKEALRKVHFYFYHSKAKNYLSGALLHLAESENPVIQKTVLFLFDFERNLRDYFKKTSDMRSNEKSAFSRVVSVNEIEMPQISVEIAPKISIATPNYNQGSFLEGCIQSILSQNYPKLEYMIIDGGSTDNSLDIIRKYENKISYWVSEKDGGQADAINKGLKRATGEIFNWINSDDRLEPYALSQCANAYQTDPSAAGWIGACIRTDAKDNIVEVIYPNGVNRENMGENWNGRQFYQPSCFLSTQMLKEVGGLNSDLFIALDLDLWLRLLEKGTLSIGRGIWSRAINHADAKTQRFIDLMMQETAELQRTLGFKEGAERRLKALAKQPFEYTIPKSLKKRLEGINIDLSEKEKIASFHKREHICFVGDFNSPEDVDAVLYFVNDIFPIILSRNWLEFHVIGIKAKNLGRKLKLHNVKFIERSTIERSILRKYKMLVCPAIRKGGLKDKIVLATDAGLPVVATALALEGLPFHDGEECFIADTPQEFGGKCNQILSDMITWQNFRLKSMVSIAEKVSASDPASVAHGRIPDLWRKRNMS
jgi:glycosyltransferase involved in cell wall biosynthesis